MENFGRSFKVNQLTFNNYSKHVELEGILFQDNLSYESNLRISVDQINKVLNFLQVENPSEDLNSMLEVDEFPNNETYYSMNLAALSGKISFEMLFPDQRYKLIRA
ncbi:MAG: hypothetical protein V4638_02325 [Bacteroidota bacterium]